MNQRVRQACLVVIVCSLLGLGVLAVRRYQAARLQSNSLANPGSPETSADLWARAVEKVKEDRGGTGAVAIEIPTQLRHYEDRHWFLATQVAAVEEFNVHSCQDFVDLAGMIERGELVSLPAVSENYILFGVGARADDKAFSRFVAGNNDDTNAPHSIAIYNDTELRDAYVKIDSARWTLQTEISALQKQLIKKPEVRSQKSAGNKTSELRAALKKAGLELQANADDKAVLLRAYGQPGSRKALSQDYESLQSLARNFAGRSYNLADSNDRYALKVSMLSSIRPQALRILEEVAKAYHDQFARPLPISSLVRPEQYQHALRRVNRNAVLIDTPPHSTGLAFDIDYRYMSGEEQNFLMKELARLKDAGAIEVIRERSANYHVFAFVDGKRPADELITASLEEAGAPPVEEDAHHAIKPATKSAIRSRPVKTTKTNSKTKKKRVR